MKNQVDPTQFIITNHVRCSTKYPGAPSDDTLCVSFFAEAIQNFQLPRKYLPPPPYQKPHFPCFRLPFQVETFTPCLQRRLLAGDPPSRCSVSSIQAGNPHPTPILLLLPHPTCPDRRRDTFHPNHRPLDTSPSYLLFQTLLPLFWTLTCMI